MKAVRNDIVINRKQQEARKVWGRWNSVIKEGSKRTHDDDFVEEEDGVKEIVKAFNDLFVEIGPDLARIIPDAPRNETEMKTIKPTNKCTTKLSMDGYDIDMKIVEDVINVCSLSFITGSFRVRVEWMKIAKVIPLYKNGDKHVFTNYRPVSIVTQFSNILEQLYR